jgi:hypothetical protein
MFIFSPSIKPPKFTNFAQLELIAHRVGQRLDVASSCEQPVHENVRVSPDGRREVRVQLAAQPVMCELGNIKISAAKILRLVHAPRCHYPDQFVEKFVVFSLNLVQTFGQLLRRRKLQFIPLLR